MTGLQEGVGTVVRPVIAHQPGDTGMWVFVLGDMVIFAAYFVIFMVARASDPTLFLESQQHLSRTVGVVNTVVMLTSSWFVARGVQTCRAANHAQALRLIVCGFGCGVAFIVFKGYEWSSEIGRGFTLPSNDFFMFYYMLTGVHLFHVVLGLIILVILVREFRNPRLRRVSVMESGATYWHMVDLLWIVLFALLYVMR